MPQQQWLEDILHQAGRLHLANEANSLLDLQEVQKSDRAAVRAHHERTNSHFDDGGDDMGNIDMSTHHHHGATEEKKKKSLLGPLAMAAACLASGGVGASIPFLTGVLGSEAPAQATATESGADSDTKFGLDLGDPLPVE